MKLRKTIYNTVTVNEKGQIVIPANARKEMGIEPNSQLAVLTRSRGETKALVLINAEEFEKKLQGMCGWFFEKGAE